MTTMITWGEEYLSQADIDKVNADLTNEWPKLRDSGVLDELFEALLVDFPPPLDILDEWVSTVNYGFQSSHSSDSNCTMVADRDPGQFRDGWRCWCRLLGLSGGVNIDMASTASLSLRRSTSGSRGHSRSGSKSRSSSKSESRDGP